MVMRARVISAGIAVVALTGCAAALAVLAGSVYTGIGGGTVLAAPGWAQAANRYDLDAIAGVSEVSVTG